MGCRRNNDNVLGESTNGRRNCRRCFEECEEALEFVEAVKDLVDDFFDDDNHNHCCRKCRRNNN